MSPEIADFEAECAAAGVAPSAAVEAGGLNSSTWFRWKSGDSSPTLRSYAAARAGLQALIDRAHDTSPSGDDDLVAPSDPNGAGNNPADFPSLEGAA